MTPEIEKLALAYAESLIAYVEAKNRGDVKLPNIVETHNDLYYGILESKETV